MTKEELKKWFIDRYNSCYAVVHYNVPNSIFLLYDKSIVRKMKICKLNNIECKIDKVTGIYLFEQDYKNKAFWCDYDEIWSFFENNYSSDYDDIQEFIKSILEEKDKMNILSPACHQLSQPIILEEKDKMNILSPGYAPNIQTLQLEEKDKMNILSPNQVQRLWWHKLEEQDKINVLTPDYLHIQPENQLEYQDKMTVLTHN